MQTEDSQIIRLYWERDEAAIKFTKETYGENLKRFAFGILKSLEDAEESESETYLRTWNSIPPQRPRYFYAYIAKICRHVSFDMLDWKNAEKRHAEIVELTVELEQCIPGPASAYDYDGNEINELLNAFLATLSKENRIIFIRRYMMADSICNIARQYGISESKELIVSYEKKLRAYLEREGIKI